MLFKRLMLAAALATAAAATQAHADALDSIMKSKVIKIAVPQDFAPFGSAASTSSRRATTSTWPI